MNARALTVGALAAAALAALAFAAPQAAAAGWLIAFASGAAVAFGAVALMLIHALTGGRWGDFAGPALRGAAALAPVLLPAFVVLLFGAPRLYPWLRAPATAGPGVAALYLNALFFAARGFVLLAGMAALALLLPRRRLAPLAAGLSLAGYCIATDLVAVDWLLSLDPRYTSSAFGTQIIVSHLVAGVSWAIFATDGEAEGAWPDLAALLLATTLGETYLILMTFIIDWYGDLPEQADWFLRRSAGGWLWLEGVGVIGGALVPLLALLFAPLRRSPRALKAIAAATLFGVVAENIWLVAPEAGPLAMLAAALAGAAIIGLGRGGLDLVSRRRDRLETSHGV